MLILPDYIIHEQVHAYDNDRIKIYRGYTAIDKTPVIIKVLEQEKATPADISRFVNEYIHTQGLKIESIIKPIRLIVSDDYFAIAIEDSKTISLREYCKDNPVELPVFLDIAIQLAQTVGKLHQNNIIHRNLKPDNIFIDPNTGKVKISDFSLAIRFSAKSEDNILNEALINLALENIQLQYMSPEQLGIVKDVIDYHSDYYTLGVIFYEMLTGQLPLHATSHAEWIRVHATQKPQAPDKINSRIPPALSAVILKLLSKTTNERYHTAWELLEDLEECKRQWNNTGKIEPFALVDTSLSHRLELPRRIFGKEAETKTLKASFELSCNGRGELVLVSGYAGTGKTMLINETLKPIVMEKGYYAYGKFDQFTNNVPYKPIFGALGNIVRQIMTESKESLEMWRSEILHALGPEWFGHY